MSYARYPEKPQIEYRNNGTTEIKYNGLQIAFRTSAKGNPMYQGMRKIDKDLEGRIVTEEIAKTVDQRKDVFRERNLNVHVEREDLLDMIEEYAYWFDESDFNVLEGILDKKLKGSPKYGTEKTQTYRQPPGTPNPQSEKYRRERFINVWRIVFRDNCTPAQAARKLGYDTDDFMD